MKSFYFVTVAIMAVFFMGIFLVAAQCEDSAFDQLSGMTNTGVTFDGSDGSRTDGWDNDFTPTASGVGFNIEPVDTGYYNQTSVSVDTSGSAASVDVDTSSSTAGSSSYGDSTSYTSASSDSGSSSSSYTVTSSGSESSYGSYDTSSYGFDSSSSPDYSSSQDSLSYGSESAD